MIETLLADIGAVYKLNEKEGSARSFKASGMKFNAKAYLAEGFGHVGLMSARGMFGLMKLETIIFNPFFVDAPIFSYDRIHAFGREILLLEMYDSLLGDTFHTEKLERLARDCPNVEWKKGCWYDSLVVEPRLNLRGGKKEASRYDDVARRFITEYLDAARAAGRCDPDEKRRKAAIYSEGLLSNGGPATDPVKKAMGEEWTAVLFRETLFGTGKA